MRKQDCLREGRANVGTRTVISMSARSDLDVKGAVDSGTQANKQTQKPSYERKEPCATPSKRRKLKQKEKKR